MQYVHVPTDSQLLNDLENKLSDLAAMWRGQKNTPAADEIVHQYQAILRCMIELGHQDSLDADSELPNRLMPQEYVDLFNDE
ncbi:MAG: hypothetical protein ABI700_26150 [Chloroflexota bacterium]